MKRMKQVAVYSFCTLLAVFTSCVKPKYQEVSTKIEMQKINGEWITKTYMLPKDCKIFVETYRGSYELRYLTKRSNWYERFDGGVLRAGVIDYKYYR